MSIRVVMVEIILVEFDYTIFLRRIGLPKRSQIGLFFGRVFRFIPYESAYLALYFSLWPILDS